MTVRTLTISTGTSRGRETYGYTIVRLRDSADGKLYRCMGGGYDMVGTVLADWLTANHQTELMTLAPLAYYFSGGDRPYRRNEGERNALYGMTLNVDTHRVSIDGACGVESVRRIAERAGVKLRALPSKRGETAGWTVGFVPGDRVRVVSPGSKHGMTATVTSVNAEEDRPYRVHLDDSDEQGWTFADHDLTDED